MERRKFLKTLVGVAAAASAVTMLGAQDAIAKTLTSTEAKSGAGASSAPAEDMPAAEAKDSYWVIYRRRFVRRYYYPRRVIFYRRYYRPRYRRIYLIRRFY